MGPPWPAFFKGIAFSGGTQNWRSPVCVCSGSGLNLVSYGISIGVIMQETELGLAMPQIGYCPHTLGVEGLG